MLQDFARFPILPPELRQAVWNATLPSPALHLFDVCITTSAGDDESSDNALTQHKHGCNETLYSRAFLDPFDAGDPVVTNQPAPGQHHCRPPGDFTSDPSVYKTAVAVRSVCNEARESIKQPIKESAAAPSDLQTNSVFMPRRGRWIHYDNREDVLGLRVRSPAPGCLSSLVCEYCSHGAISALFFAEWTAELALTLSKARRVALFVDQLWHDTSPEVIIREEVAILASCLRKDLEVLYLVQPAECARLDVTSNGQDINKRQPRELFASPDLDTIFGCGTTFQEIQQLGEPSDGKTNVIHRILPMLDEAIREQQGADARFQGVKILAGS